METETTEETETQTPKDAFATDFDAWLTNTRRTALRVETCIKYGDQCSQAQAIADMMRYASLALEFATTKAQRSTLAKTMREIACMLSATFNR